jgi:hypothetical protein
MRCKGNLQELGSHSSRKRNVKRTVVLKRLAIADSNLEVLPLVRLSKIQSGANICINNEIALVREFPVEYFGEHGYSL